MVGLPCVPQQNHVALLAACWPSQKALLNAAPTFNPDSNALGKLTYASRRDRSATLTSAYGAHRPHKLPKVAHALVGRARSQASLKPGQARTAQLTVTLAVLKRLIADCANDLGLFALDALEVIQLAVGCKDGQSHVDVEIADRAASAFHSFTTYGQATTLGPDAAVMRKFEDTLRKFAALAQQNNWFGANAARMVGIHAFDGAVSSELFYAGASHEHRAEIAISAILPSLVELEGLSQADIDKLVEKIDGESDAGAVVTRQQLHRPIAERRPRSALGVSGDKSQEASDAARAALLALQSALRSANGGDLTALLAAAARWIDQWQLWSRPTSLPAPADTWSAWLARIVAAWTPLQYRFIAVNAWIEDLREGANETTSARLHAVVAVLTGRASLAGLAVGDVLGRLLPLLSGTGQRVPADDVVRAIGALAHRSYYPDQASDLVQDIAASAGSLASDGPNVADALVAHARAIEAVLVAADSETGRVVHTAVPASGAKADGKTDGPIMLADEAGSRAPVRVEAMQDTLFLLHDTHAAVRAAYERALTLFVRQEVPRHAQTSPSSPALGQFFNALGAHAHSLATAQSLDHDTSRASSRAPSLSPREGVAATAEDIDALTEILVGAVASKSSQAVLALAPAASALGDAATLSWPSNEDAVRREGCQRLSATVLAAARATWRAGGGSPLAGLAQSSELQQASGMDESTLSNILLAPWSPAEASNRATNQRNSLATPVRRQTPLYAGGSSARSIRSTSVADLNAALGESASPTSAAPSIATSFAGGDGGATGLQRRKSGRAASIKSSRAEQLAQIGTSPHKGGRLSVYESSPYAV